MSLEGQNFSVRIFSLTIISLRITNIFLYKTRYFLELKNDTFKNLRINNKLLMLMLLNILLKYYNFKRTQ